MHVCIQYRLSAARKEPAVCEKSNEMHDVMTFAPLPHLPPPTRRRRATCCRAFTNPTVVVANAKPDLLPQVSVQFSVTEQYFVF